MSTNKELDLSNEVAEPESDPAPRSRRKGRVIVACALAAALVAGGSYGGVTWYGQLAHQAAVTSATEARVNFGQAENTNGGATSRLERDLKLAATYNLNFGKILEAAAYFNAETVADAESARAALVDQVAEHGATGDDGTFTPAVDLVPEPKLSRVIDPAQSTEELTQIKDKFVELTDTAEADTETKAEAVTALTESIATAEASLVDVADGVPEVAATILAAAPAADQPSKDAFAASIDRILTAVDDETALTAPLLSYVKAAQALKASHDAAEAARIAEEQRRAQEEAGGDSYYYEGNYYTGGGGGTGGGGTGGGGGGTGGGDTGGGGGYVPDTTRYLSTNGNYVSYGSCAGGGVVIGGHDPGPGGTSSPGYGFPWSSTGGGSEGFTFYAC